MTFPREISDRSQLLSVLRRRGIDPFLVVGEPSADIDDWTDAQLLASVSSLLLSPTAVHLDARLGWLAVGGRFACGGAEWMVTDIGTRTLCAVKVTDEARDDPSWLNGPSYALAETVFDEDDFEVISPLEAE